MIRSVRGLKPTVGPGVFLAETATLIGDVRLGENCSVWYNVTLRGDVMPIVIGKDSNIQDHAMIHGTFEKSGTVVGEKVTIGHGVILHGCEIGDECLVGMGSVVMDRAKILPRTLIGAGSLVTEGQTFPPGHLVLGRPARAVRPLNERELQFFAQSAANYLKYKTWFTDVEV